MIQHPWHNFVNFVICQLCIFHSIYWHTRLYLVRSRRLGSFPVCSMSKQYVIFDDVMPPVVSIGVGQMLVVLFSDLHREPRVPEALSSLLLFQSKFIIFLGVVNKEYFFRISNCAFPKVMPLYCLWHLAFPIVLGCFHLSLVLCWNYLHLVPVIQVQSPVVVFQVNRSYSVGAWVLDLVQFEGD